MSSKKNNKKNEIKKTTKVSQNKKEFNNKSTKNKTNKQTKTNQTKSTKKTIKSTNNKVKKNNTVNKPKYKNKNKQTKNIKGNQQKKKTNIKQNQTKQLIKPILIENKEQKIIDIKDNNEIKKETTKIQSKNKFTYISFNIIGIILITLIIIFVLSFFINKNISIKLKGNKNEVIEVYTDYKEPGWTATLFKTNINKYIKTISNLNTNCLGTYEIKYQIPFFNTHKTKRTITVVDTTAPEIKLNGEDTITIYVDDDYIEKGVTIKDNYDNDLENNLIIENNIDINTKGTYKVKYTIKDSSNNESSITRTVIVKNKPNNIKTCNNTNPISKYICENNYKVSVGYYNLKNNKTYYYNKYEQYYGASLIKTLDALYLYDKNIINDGLKSHVKKIITVSDNPSHQYLVKYIGKNNLKSYGNSLGAKYTLIGGDDFGITTVSDQIVYMKKLYNITNNNQNEELKSYFINSYYNNLLFDNCPTIMHKYGWWEEVFHNSGIVLDENPYIITILTKEAYNDYNKIISTISKLVYEYHKKN